MTKFFFFTDPGQLTTQVSTQAFGPVLNSDPASASGKDKFRVTSVHSGTNAPAIAVCDGLVCVQEDSSGTLHLLLKPVEQPPFYFPFVDYFLYKGIARSSILNGNKILDESAANATDLSTRVAKSWLFENSDLTNSARAVGIDRDASFQYDDGGTMVPIFLDENPLNHLFNLQDRDIQLAYVAAGDTLGVFEATLGFEIIVRSTEHQPKIELSRQLENFVSVDHDGLTNPLDDSNPAQFKFFRHWHRKEEVLQFLDPCAFFGSFYTHKLFAQTASGREKLKKDDIYQRVLKKFHNRNTVWLDIRNDYGFSFNYFKNSGFEVEFSDLGGTASSVQIQSHRDRWPITQLSLTDLPGQQKGNLRHTSLGLPKADLHDPAILLSRAVVKNLRKLKNKRRVPPVNNTNPTSDFLDPVALAFITTEESGQPVLMTNYYRINLYDKRKPIDAITSPIRPPKAHYLNALFQPLRLDLGINFTDSARRSRITPQETLVNLLSVGGPAYAAAICVAEDANHVTLFAYPHYFLEGKTADVAMPDAFTTWVDASHQNDQPFLQEVLDVFRTKEARKVVLEVENVPGVIEQIDTIRIRNQPFQLGNYFRQVEYPEDYVFVILQKTDYAAVQNALRNASVFDQELPRFLTVANDLQKVDENGVVYREIELAVTGYRNNAGTLEQHVINLNQKIYEYADF